MVMITKERQNEIDRVIQDVLLKAGKSYPENNILEIVNSLGISVYIIDFNKYFQDGGDKIKGVIEYGDTGRNSRILISKKLSKSERTFTIAHELGHYVLHEATVEGRFRVDNFDYHRTGEESTQETEANYFAASLLVPKEELLNLSKGTNIIDNLELVAEYFGVSRSVIINRLKWLNINQ